VNVLPFDEMATTAEDVTVQVRQVAGIVFKDSNSNGAQGTGETGVSGVTVQLKNTSGSVVATTTTASDGSYLFSPVAAGNYTVTKVNPPQAANTTADPVSITVPDNGTVTVMNRRTKVPRLASEPEGGSSPLCVNEAGLLCVVHRSSTYFKELVCFLFLCSCHSIP
jgi:hypothetical protein